MPNDPRRNARPTLRWPSAGEWNLVRVFILALTLAIPINAALAKSGAESPRALHKAFTAAFNAKDLDQLIKLYEPSGALVPEPGTVVVGHTGVRAALQGFLAVPGKLKLETLYVVENGEIALVRSQWQISDGDKINAASSGIEIMRRGADGRWRFVIDHAVGGSPTN